jgi:hypothetical protein
VSRHGCASCPEVSANLTSIAPAAPTCRPETRSRRRKPPALACPSPSSGGPICSSERHPDRPGIQAGVLTRPSRIAYRLLRHRAPCLPAPRQARRIQRRGRPHPSARWRRSPASGHAYTKSTVTVSFGGTAGPTLAQRPWRRPEAAQLSLPPYPPIPRAAPRYPAPPADGGAQPEGPAGSRPGPWPPP